MTNDNGTIPFRPRPVAVTPQVTPSDHQAAIVEMFERYLAAAKAGKVRFAAVATVDKEFISLSTWEPNNIPPQVISAALGSISFLNHRFNSSCDDGCDHSDSYEPEPA
jgi:hypothetical protein